MSDTRVARSKAVVSAAVVELVISGGLGAVTMDAVSARSGVAKTTLYRHWDSREELLADVLASALPEPPVPDTGSLESDVRVLARGLAAGLADDRFSALLGAIAFPDGDPVLDRVRAEATRARHAAVRAVVERARRRGEPVPPDGADGIIRAIAGPLFYRRYVEGVPPTALLADRCVERALATRAPAPSSGSRGRP